MFSRDSHDGSSYEKAIVVTAENEQDGVEQEYLWIEENCGGCKFVSQGLNFNENRPYDVFELVDAQGVNRKVHFDIMSFYGKR